MGEILLHVAGIVATGTLAEYLYDDLGQPLLGYACIGILLWLIVHLFYAIQDDLGNA